MKTSLYLVFISSLMTISACTTKSVVSGAERLRVFETEPKNCLYMGEVSSVQDNEDTVINTKDVEMTLNTRIDLRNKAFELNGNILVFMSKNKAKLATTNSTVMDAAKKDAKPSDSKDTKAVAAAPEGEKIPQTVFLATVFRCPPNILNQ